MEIFSCIYGLGIELGIDLLICKFVIEDSNDLTVEVHFK